MAPDGATKGKAFSHTKFTRKKKADMGTLPNQAKTAIGVALGVAQYRKLTAGSKLKAAYFSQNLTTNQGCHSCQVMWQTLANDIALNTR